MKLVYNYHTHTKRCGHATGEDEEYVISAIKYGIKRLAITDHVMLPYVHEPKVRGDYSQLEEYLDSVKLLKEKYKDQIEILVGFEAEYYDVFVDYYKWLLKEKVDFLILGQHNYVDNYESVAYFHKDSPIEDIVHYTDDVVKGIESGLFKYVAHPDMLMYSQKEFTKEIEAQARRILAKCEEYNMPIEINICGMRRPSWNGKSYGYPSDEFFELVKDYKLKVVLGIDAHDPSHFNQADVDRAIEFAKKHGVKVEEDYYI